MLKRSVARSIWISQKCNRLQEAFTVTNVQISFKFFQPQTVLNWRRYVGSAVRRFFWKYFFIHGFCSTSPVPPSNCWHHHRYVWFRGNLFMNSFCSSKPFREPGICSTDSLRCYPWLLVSNDWPGRRMYYMYPKWPTLCRYNYVIYGRYRCLWQTILCKERRDNAALFLLISEHSPAVMLSVQNCSCSFTSSRVKLDHAQSSQKRLPKIELTHPNDLPRIVKQKVTRTFSTYVENWYTATLCPKTIPILLYYPVIEREYYEREEIGGTDIEWRIMGADKWVLMNMERWTLFSANGFSYNSLTKKCRSEAYTIVTGGSVGKKGYWNSRTSRWSESGEPRVNWNTEYSR